MQQGKKTAKSQNMKEESARNKLFQIRTGKYFAIIWSKANRTNSLVDVFTA